MKVEVGEVKCGWMELACERFVSMITVQPMYNFEEFVKRIMKEQKNVIS